MTADQETRATPVDPSVPADYQITIKHCNSIAEARISLRRSSLNIKYGPNGIGKSTIARALTLRAEGEEALQDLLPFKHRVAGDWPKPTVEGAESIGSVLTFNDSYVAQFVFQRDEVLKNSFEIFINTAEYRRGLEAIESMFDGLKNSLADQPEFDGALSAFSELRDAFGVTKSGAISKTSRGFKALGVGGKLDNVPERLEGYKPFLHGTDPAGWITWQSKGNTFLDHADSCPFCATPSVDKDTAKQVSKEYESAAVRNLSALRRVIESLGRYFEPKYLQQLRALTSSIEELSPEEGQFLATLRGQVETFLGKLESLRGLSFHVLRDVEDVDVVLRGLKIDLALLHALESDATKSVVDLINEKLDDVAAQINDIRRTVGEQKTRVAKLIRENQDAINEFLGSAGYRYSVRIEPSGNSYRMILEHEDARGHLESAASHLSYGEKNAFALVLFMHHVRRDQPDLVVLDDPVSSFDKTKKFAILHQLFHGKSSIRDFTCLLLTHDLEPAIDIVRTGTASRFSAARPIAHFLSGRSGLVSEKLITRNEISTFSQVCDANIANSVDDVIKCIYLRRRFELHGDLGVEYDLLSSLLHLRDTPDRAGEAGERLPLEQGEIEKAANSVKEFFPEFDYARILGTLRDPAALKAKFKATHVGYEKVQLFRILSELAPNGLKGDDAFKKFVNESYHIENEYVMQLNPRDFDAVPDYVVAACAERVEHVMAT